MKKTRKIFEPLNTYSFAGDPNTYAAGEKALAEGRVGCLIIAGGIGSRLGYEGPKGAFPLDKKGTTLFKIHCEKIFRRNQKDHIDHPIAIMTSDENDLSTRKYFEDNAYFGLKKENVAFFKQRSLPLVDTDGHSFYDDVGHLAVGPNGNGELLHLFVESSLSESWKQQGIEILTNILVDNALAEPFDPELIGRHLLDNNEITIKAIERKDAKEKVGVLVKEKGKINVVEYSEIDAEEQEAVDDAGKLKHPLANISLFVFSLSFAENAAATTMPLHAAWKKCPYLDAKGKRCIPDFPNAWKRETFIFDLLPLAERVSILVYPRTHCYAPLKNKEGPDSPQTVLKAIAR